MKSSENVVIDPIKAKYTKKVGFFKKIQMKFNNFREKYKIAKKENKDVMAAHSIVGDIILYGLIGNASAVLFNLRFSFVNIIAIGCVLWLIDNRVITWIKDLFNSLNLVKVYK